MTSDITELSAVPAEPVSWVLAPYVFRPAVIVVGADSGLLRHPLLATLAAAASGNGYWPFELRTTGPVLCWVPEWALRSSLKPSILGYGSDGTGIFAPRGLDEFDWDLDIPRISGYISRMSCRPVAVMIDARDAPGGRSAGACLKRLRELASKFNCAVIVFVDTVADGCDPMRRMPPALRTAPTVLLVAEIEQDFDVSGDAFVLLIARSSCASNWGGLTFSLAEVTPANGLQTCAIRWLECWKGTSRYLLRRAAKGEFSPEIETAIRRIMTALLNGALTREKLYEQIRVKGTSTATYARALKEGRKREWFGKRSVRTDEERYEEWCLWRPPAQWCNVPDDQNAPQPASFAAYPSAPANADAAERWMWTGRSGAPEAPSQPASAAASPCAAWPFPVSSSDSSKGITASSSERSPAEISPDFFESDISTFDAIQRFFPHHLRRTQGTGGPESAPKTDEFCGK